MKYKAMPLDLQVNFFFRLKADRPRFFGEALQRAVLDLEVPELDKQLAQLVPHKALKCLASVSLRGEIAFPVPLLLRHDPYLLGYYRLVYGISRKEFYDKGPFGAFKGMEDHGKIGARVDLEIESLCKSLIESATQLITTIDEPTIARLSELQLLTIGAQYRGTRNNDIGKAATDQVFVLIKKLLARHIKKQTTKSLSLTNASGRKVDVRFAADPDIEVVEHLSKSKKTVLSVEIKGGADASNVHNRIGEAEKSHVKAKANGCHEFVTIVNVDIDTQQLKKGSPTTSYFFHLDQLLDARSEEAGQFKDLIASVTGVHI